MKQKLKTSRNLRWSQSSAVNVIKKKLTDMSDLVIVTLGSAGAFSAIGIIGGSPVADILHVPAYRKAPQILLASIS